MPLFTIKSDKAPRGANSAEYGSLQPTSRCTSVRHFFSLDMNDNCHSDVASTGAAALLIAGILLLVSGISFYLWKYIPDIASENGLLEVGQDIFLSLAFVTALLRYWPIRCEEGLSSTVFLALTLCSLAFLLREVDIDKLGSSSLWPVAEKVLRGIAAVALLGFIFSVLRKIKLLLRNLASILTAPVMILTILGGLLYISSWPFDKKMLAMDKGLSQLCEEIIELNACLLFAFAAFSRGVKQEKPL